MQIHNVICNAYRNTNTILWQKKTIMVYCTGHTFSQQHTQTSLYNDINIITHHMMYIQPFVQTIHTCGKQYNAQKNTLQCKINNTDDN